MLLNCWIIYIYIIQASECQHFIIFCEGKKKHLMPADFLVSGKGYRYTDIPSLFRTFSKEMDSNSICMLHSKVGQTFQFLFANKFQAGKFRPGGTEVSSFKGTVQFFFIIRTYLGHWPVGTKIDFWGDWLTGGSDPREIASSGSKAKERLTRRGIKTLGALTHRGIKLLGRLTHCGSDRHVLADFKNQIFEL